MVPAYLALTVLLAAVGRRLLMSDASASSSWVVRLSRWGGYTLIALLLFVSTALSYAFPIFQLPTPSGSYHVGTSELHLTDESRTEAYTEDTSDKRELMVRVWYPASNTERAERAYYWNHASTRSKTVTVSTPLPWFTFTHLKRVPTNSYWDAPIATDQSSYPVVIYSHGTGIGWESANTNLAEELASDGYIVVGINHTHIGSVSIFPDGRVVQHHRQTAEAMSVPPSEGMADIQAKMRASVEWQEQIDLYEQAMAIMPDAALAAVGAALDTQVADQRTVVEQLAKLKAEGADGPIKHMDLDRIGVVGMSLGGSAAFENCLANSHCTAGVNLDGFHPRHIGLAPKSVPFMYLHRENNLLHQSHFQNSTVSAYSVSIPDATHFNFFDFSIMSPLYKRMGILGPMDGHRMLSITQVSVRAFFDVHLRGKSAKGWSAQLAHYPEIGLNERNTD